MAAIFNSASPKPMASSSKQNDGVGLSTPVVRLLGGMTSGAIEALFLTPLDVTKTRLQLDNTGRYKNMLDCGRKLFAAEGFTALYKGFTPWTCHVVLKNGTRYGFNAVYKTMLMDKDGKLTSAKQFTAGALAGATEATLIVTPFEVIKIRMQAQDKVPEVVSAASDAKAGAGEAKARAETQAPTRYTNMFQAARTIVAEEGPLALWKGLLPTICRQGLNQAGSFLTNSLLKQHVWKVEEGEKMAVWKSALGGVIGAIPGPCINCPADVIKTRLMNQRTPIGGAPPKYTGMVQAFQVILKEEGVLALYKGLGPRLARLCPSYAIQWVVIDKFMEAFAPRQ
eukprot:CAMPEP_0113938844 /NCGR_PEP_ID=MMETSP1339-20121228/5251_1 /TAXON_ID=94617 /ORGANISM="Fibrocapsa japonica" /LENGTH=338 /DNA_ID=CAMNT_0000942137 /DNA_START=49 /DNA_END=1065 /DNA_ORIENTATION=+ /assembly_acc=CAM_ASM_000762